ncbi:MAG: tetratricopeptide repeat protein, partial [Gemmatimonadales bacterium]
ANTLNALAGVLRDERRFAEAEPFYRRALDIRERAFGSDNRDVKETLRDYAQLLRSNARNREAARLEARAGIVR